MPVTGSEEDPRPYRVVVNDDDQYSVWPLDRAVPDGWHAVDRSGTRRECLDHIAEVWNDLRPRRLR